MTGQECDQDGRMRRDGIQGEVEEEKGRRRAGRLWTGRQGWGGLRWEERGGGEGPHQRKPAQPGPNCRRGHTHAHLLAGCTWLHLAAPGLHPHLQDGRCPKAMGAWAVHASLLAYAFACV